MGKTNKLQKFTKRKTSDCLIQKFLAILRTLFFNYIDLTQYIERGHKNIMIRSGKESAVDEFIQKNAKFIPHPELQENYIRAYGKG